jgi:hypothetical protein
MNMHDYIHQHRMAVIFVGVWAWISLSLIIRLWLKDQSVSVTKKILWSLALCIPFFGWLAYGAFYSPLKDNDVPSHVNADAFNGGH